MVYGKDALKGRFTPLHPEKYVGDVRNIIYRSSFELKFMKMCDSNSGILKWNSEEIVVPYISPIDNAMHRYFVDFTIQTNTKNGVKTFMVEVKPYKYTQEPVIPSKKTKRFLQEVVQWGVNQAKWNAARSYARTRNWDFVILTEKELEIRY